MVQLNLHSGSQFQVHKPFSLQKYRPSGQPTSTAIPLSHSKNELQLLGLGINVMFGKGGGGHSAANLSAAGTGLISFMVQSNLHSGSQIQVHKSSWLQKYRPTGHSISTAIPLSHLKYELQLLGLGTNVMFGKVGGGQSTANSSAAGTGLISFMVQSYVHSGSQIQVHKSSWLQKYRPTGHSISTAIPLSHLKYVLQLSGLGTNVMFGKVGGGQSGTNLAAAGTGLIFVMVQLNAHSGSQIQVQISFSSQ